MLETTRPAQIRGHRTMDDESRRRLDGWCLHLRVRRKLQVEPSNNRDHLQTPISAGVSLDFRVRLPLALEAVLSVSAVAKPLKARKSTAGIQRSATLSLSCLHLWLQTIPPMVILPYRCADPIKSKRTYPQYQFKKNGRQPIRRSSALTPQYSCLWSAKPFPAS